MATVELSGSKQFDTQMALHTAKQSTDMSLAQEIQNTCQIYHADTVL